MISLRRRARRMRLSRPIEVLLAITTAAVVTTGCAAATNIPSQPFQAFEESIAQLKISADAALATEQDIVYQRYLDEWQTSGAIEDLQLQTSETPTPFSMELEGSILFKDIEAARARLAELNSLVLEYAGTLITLTGSAVDSTTVDANALADELRAKATLLAARLGREREISDGYFFGFGVLAENYLADKRQDLLSELIRSSQEEIEAFAQAGQQICQISGLGIQAEYQAAFSKLTAGVPANRRGELAERILQLNDDTLRQLDTLKLIYDAYGALPAAHGKLERAAAGDASFVELLAYAELLKKRYDEFEED